MAVCSVCGSMFDNVSGVCPECGAQLGGGASVSSPEQLYREAMERIRAGQLADAKGLLSQAVSQQPDNFQYQFYFGSSLYKLGDYRGAYTAWQKADRLRPKVDRVEKCLVAARQRISEEQQKKS